MFPIVADHVKEAMGDILFDKFLVRIHVTLFLSYIFCFGYSFIKNSFGFFS